MSHHAARACACLPWNSLRSPIAQWISYDLLVRHLVEPIAGQSQLPLDVVAAFLQVDAASLTHADGPASELVGRVRATYPAASMQVRSPPCLGRGRVPTVPQPPT